MAKDLTPRTTEYLGTVYRSKCEAMFARFLQLDCEEMKEICDYQRPNAGYNTHVSGFMYEPLEFTIDGWTPDFVTFSVTRHPSSLAGIPCLTYKFIEYKPSEPTKVYIKEWTDRCKSLYELLEEKQWFDIAYRSEFELYYGSVFSDVRDRIWCQPDTGWASFRTGDDWLINYEDEVRATRFDLKAKV